MSFRHLALSRVPKNSQWFLLVQISPLENCKIRRSAEYLPELCTNLCNAVSQSYNSHHRSMKRCPYWATESGSDCEKDRADPSPFTLKSLKFVSDPFCHRGQKPEGSPMNGPDVQRKGPFSTGRDFSNRN